MQLLLSAVATPSPPRTASFLPLPMNVVLERARGSDRTVLVPRACCERQGGGRGLSMCWLIYVVLWSRGARVPQAHVCLCLECS